MAGICFVNGDI